MNTDSSGSGHEVPTDDIRRRFSRSIQHLLDDYAPLEEVVPLG